ncbi:MAG: hypothetical protein JXR12_06650 [Neptunomonas phycophila]|uniref:hypothetical protein n=1 Tax=Neptunomonas phycophila TaxID=1572645 RepID=UPI003B8CEEE3
MSKINTIFNRVYRPLATQAANGEEFEQGSMRKQFIFEVTTTEDKAIQLTKNGAASYYQMCRQRANGKDMYGSHKKWNKKNAEAVKAEKSTDEGQIDQPVIEEQIKPEVNVDMSNRWLVGNKAEKHVFASFTTRTAAQTHNKELKEQGVDSNWIDGSKINKEEFTPVAVGQ